MRIPLILFAGICLVFTSTDALAQIYVKNQGNVGIGINSPTQKLHVSGKTLLESNDNVLTFNSPSNTWQFVAFNKSGVRNAWMGLSAAKDFYISNEQPGHIYLAPVSGKVIIQSLLDNGDVGGSLTFTNAQKYNVAGAAMNWSIYNMSGGYGNSLQFWAYTPSSSFSALTLKDDGNVGIGTMAPAQKLHVAGTVRAITYIADAGNPWPDYVFASTYQLPALRELENYIKQNHHLPEVPSAEEVKKDGIDLTSNQTVLLKKIEELTLYVIEQNKNQELQNQQMKEQQELIKKLSSLLESLQERVNVLEKQTGK